MEGRFGRVPRCRSRSVKARYKHIDAASVYGNEAEVGDAIAEAISAGTISRSDLFVTSKLWNSEHGPQDVEAACRQTLKDLKLDYLDLYLVHWPQAFEKVPGRHFAFPRNEDNTIRYDTTTTHEETWKAMEKLVDIGLVRNIGLSNFNSAQTDALCSTARIHPAVLQVEVHPFFTQKPLADFCASKNIVVTAYSLSWQRQRRRWQSCSHPPCP